MTTEQTSPGGRDPLHAQMGIVDVPAGTVSDDVPFTEPPRSGMLAAVVLAMGVAAYGAMETMVAPIIPVVQGELGGTGPQITWMLTGMLLTGAISLPLMSRLAEIMDKRTVFVGSLVIACVGAVMAALASSISVLIAGQLLQGVGLASVTVAIGVLRDTLPEHRLHAANGVVLGSASTAAAVGLLLVGPIIDHLHYTFVFWIPVTIMVATIIGTFFLVPPCPPRERGSADWLGAVVIGCGLAGVLIGLTLSSTNPWLSFKVLGLMVLGGAAVVGFVLIERRVESPLMDVRAMGERDSMLILGSSLVAGLTQFTIFVIVPSLATLPVAIGYGMGGGSNTASHVLFTFVAAAAVAALVVTRVVEVIGWRAVLVLSGAGIVAAGLSLLFIGSIHLIPFIAAGVAGLSIGAAQLQTLNIMMDIVPADRAPSVAGSLWIVRSVGGTFGSQIAAAILAAHLVAGLGVSSWTGYVSCILVIVGGGAVVVVLSLLMRCGTKVPQV